MSSEVKRAHPLELFFDLVFVFAITQIVSLVVHDLTWNGMFHGALILALLWWAWSHYTWTCNAVDLDPRIVRVGILAAMVPIFIMAQAVPFAFDGRGQWLAYGYLAIRSLAFVIGLTSGEHTANREGQFRWLPWAMLGPIVIVVGSYMGDAQQWWWLAGWGLELFSTRIAGTTEWQIKPEHFAERHGLIMIIAFGEAIVAIGSIVVDEEPSFALASLLAVGILGAIALWWEYFDRMEDLWEWALARAKGVERGLLARDVYSILHYPMIAGVVLYAVAVEEVILHPEDPMETMVQVALAMSLLLFIVPIVIATWRAVRGRQFERAAAAGIIVAVIFATGDMQAKNVLLITTVLLVISMFFEYMRFRTRIREGLPTEEEEFEAAEREADSGA